MYFIYLHSCCNYVIIIEFRSNGNWRSNVSVHPSLSLHEPQPNGCQASICKLHTTSTLFVLHMSLYSMWPYHLHKHQVMCVLYNTGSSDISVEVVVAGALSAAHQMNSRITNNHTLEYLDDRASDDRAPRCRISSHDHHKSRRRHVAWNATAANYQCMQVLMLLYFH